MNNRTEEFEATIRASRLKHAISVLRRMDDEAIFRIDHTGMHCRLAHTGNVASAQVDIAADAFEAFNSPLPTENLFRIGVDLDKMAGKVLKRASANDMIDISGDKESWTFTRGIHQKTIGLLQPDRLRKPATSLNLPHTAATELTGKEFKDIVAEAADVSERVLIHATSNALTFVSESNELMPDRYKCALLVHRYKRYDSEAESMYSLQYLQDAATDMKAADEVLFQFSSDMPCEISYVRDGMKISIMLAPHIESD